MFLLNIVSDSVFHVNKIFKVAGDVLSNMSSSTCEMESLRSKLLEYVAFKRASRRGVC